MKQQQDHARKATVKRIPLFKRRYLLNPKFQFSFMGHICVGILIALLLVYGANVYFLNSYIVKGQSLNLPPNHIFFRLIFEQKVMLTKIFCVTGALLSLIFSIIGLFISHRVAGPLYRVETFFRHGFHHDKLKKLSFREDDFFQELPPAINDFLKNHKLLEEIDEQDENIH